MNIGPVSGPPQGFDSGNSQNATYTVQRGDTMWQIARQHGIPLSSLIAANPQVLNPDLIYPDQVLNLPGGGGAPTSEAASTQASASSVGSMPELRIGARGEAVAELQRQLTAAGFSPGPIDGWFGPQTQAAVRNFQAGAGIVVDGWVGAQTWGALGNGGVPQSASQPATGAGPGAPVVPATGVSDARLQTVLDYGLSHIGAPYVGGGSPFRFGTPGNGQTYQMDGQRAYVSPQGVQGFDCSGLVVAMYRQIGIDLAAQATANTRTMHANLQDIGKNELRPGDLLVKPGSHVVIFLGDYYGDGVNRVLEAKPPSVAISGADGFINNGDYHARRVPLP